MSTTTRLHWLLVIGLLLLRMAAAKRLSALFEDELEELVSRLHDYSSAKDAEVVSALQKLRAQIRSSQQQRPGLARREQQQQQHQRQQQQQPTVVLMDQQQQQQQQEHQWELYNHLTKPDWDNYEYSGTKKPVFIYPKGKGESDLPVCRDKNEVCSKVDVYGEPWIERLCRCPGARKCSRSVNSKDGHTIVDKTKHYKLCEPVKRLPTCQPFKDVSITMKAPKNGTISIKVYCKCRPVGTAYIIRSDDVKAPDGSLETIYSFGCSPSSMIKCKKKDPCRLFSLRNMDNYPGTDVTVSRLCECPRGHYCPRHHNDFGSTSYYSRGNKLYNGHCMPNIFLPFDSSRSSNSHSQRKKQQQQQQMYTVVN